VQAEVSRFVRTPLAALEAKKETQWLAGLVVGVRSKFTARGKMAFVQLDDGTTARSLGVQRIARKPSGPRSGKTRC
jgi:DNA polymerase-3 subunit alpha